MLSHPNLLTSHEVDVPLIDSEDAGTWIVDGIQTTGWHFYSRNHMWLDIDEDGICHVGIDPFFARVRGKNRQAYICYNFQQAKLCGSDNR